MGHVCNFLRRRWIAVSCVARKSECIIEVAAIHASLLATHDDMFRSQLKSGYTPFSYSWQQVNELEESPQNLKEERDEAIATIDEYKVCNKAW